MITDDIAGKFVRLRIADEQDAEFTLTIRQNNKNTKFMPKLNVDLSAQKKWLKTQRDSCDCYFFVIERLDGTRIGTFSLYNIEENEGETGRLIMQGNPIESLETFVLFHDFCFQEAGMQVVHSEIEDGNNAAIGLALRVGSREYGRRHDEKSGIQMFQMKASKADYMEKREKLAKLVDRFVARG